MIAMMSFTGNFLNSRNELYDITSYIYHIILTCMAIDVFVLVLINNSYSKFISVSNNKQLKIR